MEQEPSKKSLDSLTDKEKEELDQSLGSDVEPEELTQAEQEELEEMALEGDNSKNNKAESSFPRKAEPEQKKPKEKSSRSGRHPAISSSPQDQPKPWRPEPVKVNQQESQDQSESKKDFNYPDRRGSGESVWRYLGLAGATILAVMIIFFGLAYVDAKGYLNLGVNQICTSFGMEGGCLPFAQEDANPIDDLVEIRQAYQSTNSHKFEAQYSISYPGQEGGDSLSTISGSARGSVNSQGADLLISLDSDEANSNTIYSDFASELISAKMREDRLALESSKFFFEDNLVEIVEDDFISSFQLLSLTSGGLNSVSKDSQGELDKYEIVLDGSSIVDDSLGQASSLKVTIYSSVESNLPQELDFEGTFSKGELTFKKRYTEYNSVESLEGEIEASDKVSSLSMLDLVVNMKKTTKTRDEMRKEDLAQIQSALESYYQDNESYPQAEELDQIDRTGSLVADKLIPDSITQIPQDPLFDRHFYGYTSDGESYTLSCVIENENDKEAEQINGIYLYRLTSTE